MPKTIINYHISLLFILFLFVLFQNGLIAQTNRTQEEVYTVNEGLASRYTTTIHQDDRGLIWIGTEGGLCTFNGYEFLIFNAEADENRRLSETFINLISPSKDGRLIITYRDNVQVFDFLHPHTHQIQSVKISPENGIKGQPIGIRIHPKGDIFVITSYKDSQYILHKWSYEQQFVIIKEVNIPNQLKHEKINFYITSDETLWIKSDFPKIWEIQHENEWIDRTPPSATTSTYKDGQLAETIFYEDNKNQLWVSLANQPGVFVKSPNSSIFSFAPKLPQEQIYNRLWQDNQGNYLVVASSRHWRYAPTEAVYLLSSENEIQDFSFLIHRDRYLLAASADDFNDVLYIGMDPGFKVVKNNYSNVTTYFDVDPEKVSYAPIMRGIVEDSVGHIYAAKESFYWMYINRHTNEQDTIFIKDERGRDIDLQCSKNLVIQDGYLWGVSCKGETNGFLIRYDIDKQTSKIYNFDYRLDYVLIDSKGKFWIVGDRGEQNGILLNFDPETGISSPYQFKENINPLASVRPQILYESRDQTIWIGTNNGLFFVNPNTGNYGVYKDDDPNSVQLPSDYIMDIYENEEGQLLLGTSNGLCILNQKEKFIQIFKKKDGLPNNLICGILPDDKGNYWLSTYNGLSYFDTKTHLFRNFYSTDGLSNDEFNKVSSLRDKMGRFYFGGINGVSSFLSEELLQQVTPPPPLLTQITRFDNSKDTLIEQNYGLSDLTDLVISPSIGYFQIDFALAQFVNPNKNQFQIMLEGLDTDWSYLGNNHSIRYNFLPPGNYTLKIKGADSKGNWSETSRDLNIHVQQVFYKKNWFIVLCSLGFTLFVFAVERFRSKQRLKVEKLRTKISSDLHDEVSGLLSGIAMQTDILQMTIQDEKSKKRLQKMGIVSRSAMSRMSDVIWSIDSRKDQLEDLLHRMHGHAEELLTPLQIPYNFALENLQKQKKLPVELRQNLYFIFKESINNIAKHSNATRVNITIQNTDNQFIMSIHDDGTTAKDAKEKPKPGQGLSNLKMRADRIKAELEIDITNGFLVELRRKKL